MNDDDEATRPVMRFDRPSEWPRIKALLDDAFGRETESALVERLRGDGAFSFMIVAEIGEGFIGACGFSPLPIHGEERSYDGAALGPLAVAAPFRGAGVGSALVRAGLAQCRRRNLGVVCALGSPRFFNRLGFSRAAASEIASPWTDAPAYQALVLRDELAPVVGEARYADAYFNSADMDDGMEATNRVAGMKSGGASG